MHIPTDKDKIIEMEKYRISMRHLAVMMGKNPDEFTFEDQQKAIRYLMPGQDSLMDPLTVEESLYKPIFSGYSLFGEGTPRLTHPIMYMHEYTRKADAEAARKYGDIQGRPNNMFYFSPIYYNGKGYFTSSNITVRR